MATARAFFCATLVALSACAKTPPTGPHLTPKTATQESAAPSTNSLPTRRDRPANLASTRAVNVPPTIMAPSDVSAIQLSSVSFTVIGSDGDGDLLTYSAALVSSPDPSKPATGWTFDAASGAFSWTPTCGDLAGVYVFSFCAADSFASACDTTKVTLTSVNQPPTALTGGPYAGIVGIPVKLDGSQSLDPDGSIVDFTWTLDNGSKNPATVANGMIVDHTYLDAGTFSVQLKVTDSGPCPASDADFTTAEITKTCNALVFRCPSSSIINLQTNKQKPPPEFVRVEPISQCFALSDIDIASVRMKFDGKEIAPDKKNVLVGDATPCHNGTDDLQLSFSLTDLKYLFSSLSKKQSVSVTVSGSLFTGGGFADTVVLIVQP